MDHVAPLCAMLLAGPAAAAGDPTLDPPSEHAPAPLAGDERPHGVLEFEIRDAEGRLGPGRLLFIGPDGPGATLFPVTDAAPLSLAVRDDLVYTLHGRGAITVPAGRYTVYASRGLEWSVDSTEIQIEPDGTSRWTARLEHELDTTGWVSGDFHLHTLTYSGHGDSNMPERIISLIGEGVEFAVATDHNHHTDYRPTIDSLEATSMISSVTGNEVSTAIGHFNAFPLEPGTPPLEHRLRDANALFALIREHESSLGVTPLIQVNHPRWGNIDYFGQTVLDPVTGDGVDATYSDDFEAIEVLNENAGWGYEDAETSSRPTGASRHRVLQDWYNLLDRGHRAAAVGNSDSHHVRAILAGYPRNFVRSATDHAGSIDPVDIVDAIRGHEVFTTTGPFVRWSVDGAAMGSTVTAGEGSVEIQVTVDAASWIDVRRVLVVLNGGLARTVEVPASRASRRLSTTFRLFTDVDAWAILIVEGDEPLAPVLHDSGRPVLPLAITNPVWIDADGVEGWSPPIETARRLVAEAVRERAPAATLLGTVPSGLRGAVVLAGAEHPELARSLVPLALAAGDRRVRLCAARAAERLADLDLARPLERLLEDARTDPYLATAAVRALHAIDVADGRDATSRLVTLVEQHGSTPFDRYDEELASLVGGAFVDTWMVLGYFAADGDAPLAVDRGPESAADLRPVVDADGVTHDWQRRVTRPDGFLSLLGLEADDARSQQAIAYARTWLYSEAPRRVLYTLGTDDGCRLMLDGVVVHEDPQMHGATPLQHVGLLDLPGGWSRVDIEVHNGEGNFGLYFRVADERVRSSIRIHHGDTEDTEEGR